MTALFASRFEGAVKLLEQSKQLNDNTIDWHLAMATYYAGDHERAETILAGIHGSANVRKEWEQDKARRADM